MSHIKKCRSDILKLFRTHPFLQKRDFEERTTRYYS
jgi:hypothetical protein